MKRAFYDPLSALWMMKNHGMTFETRCGNPACSDMLLLLIDNATSENVYPDADGIALLVPRVGNSVIFNRSIYNAVYGSIEGFGKIAEDDRRMVYEVVSDEEFNKSNSHESQYDEDHYFMGRTDTVRLSEAIGKSRPNWKEHPDYWEPRYFTVFRKGKAFIVPSWEE